MSRIFLYKISCNKTNHFYYGQTNNPKHRWSQHLSELRANKHSNRYMQHVWNQHPEEFSFEVQTDVDCRDEAIELEQLIIDMTWDLPGRMNLAPEAQVPPPTQITPEWKEKMRKINTGRIKSAEARARLSASLKGRIVSESTRKKLSIANTGRKLSEEAKKKMSIAKTGTTWSEERKIARGIPIVMITPNGTVDFYGIRECARYLDIAPAQIRNILQGKQKTLRNYPGYTFQYKVEVI